MALKNRTIAIIGGGIAGMSAAVALCRRGAEVTLFEERDDGRETGAGLQISANGIRAIAGLGLLDQVKAKSNNPSKVELCDAISGAQVAAVPLHRADRPYFQSLRQDLLSVLTDAAVDGGTCLQYGSRQSTEVLPRDFSLVVAADGVGSATRQKMIGGKSARFTGYVAWRALVPSEKLADPEQFGETRLWMAPGAHMVTYPLDEGRLINLVLIEGSREAQPESWDKAADPTLLERKTQRWAPPLRQLAAATEQLSVWGLFDHPPLSGWRKGNVILCGDAAHPMLPFLGQGANMALEDAHVLADLLEDLPQEEALTEFENLRIPRTNAVQAASLGQARLYHAKNILWRKALHLGMRASPGLVSRLAEAKTSWIHDFDVTS